MTSTLDPTPRVADFGGLTIAYDARVLQPRPWTAAQSRWAADLLLDAPEGPVLELCAGAGQIGLLAVAGSERRLVCVDVSPVACAYAASNAAAAGLDDRVEVREGRLEDVLPAEERFALVVADPPWVPAAEVGRFPEDPLVAIDGGEDGLDLARSCLRTAGAHLLPSGSVVLQVGSLEQAETLSAEQEPTDLRVVEVRQEERGVLLRLVRA